MKKVKTVIDSVPYKLPATALLVSAIPMVAHGAEASTWVAPDRWFTYAIVAVVLAGSVISLLLIRAALTVSVWSFSDALSEPIDTTAMEIDAAGISRIKLDAEGKPMIITEMRASSSRMIALMGTIVILLMFLGFGAVALYSFSSTGTLPESMDKVVNFLLAGLTLFAPYAVNKFSNIFERLSPKKR